MKKNMGATDRTIRVLIALAVIVLYFMNVIAGTLAIILLVVSFIFVFTSIFSFCPLYAALGISTCKRLK